MEETMRPTTAFEDNVFDVTALLHPGTVFDHRRDVVAHPSLSISEKRAILASRASDASAIASCPALRALAGLKAPATMITAARCEPNRASLGIALCADAGRLATSGARAFVIRPRRKFDGCWRDPCGRRLRHRSNSDREAHHLRLPELSPGSRVA
jgi:hypothetical protein